MMLFREYYNKIPVDGLRKKIYDLRHDIVKIAQGVYDAWDEGEIYAGGGICHLIAEEIASYLNDKGIESWTHSLDYKQHVVVISVDHNTKEACMVDIYEGLYEEGGGFSWKKIHDVEFDVNDVEIQYINYEEWGNPDEY